MARTTKYISKELEYAEDALLLAHEVLHSEIRVLTIVNSIYPVHIFRNAGCRYITLYGVTYVQQNRTKNSKWGAMARKGHKITWGIRRPGSTWHLCVNENIIGKEERKTFQA